MTKLRILRWEILQDYLAGLNVIISLKMEAGGGSEERERAKEAHMVGKGCRFRRPLERKCTWIITAAHKI